MGRLDARDRAQVVIAAYESGPVRAGPGEKVVPHTGFLVRRLMRLTLDQRAPRRDAWCENAPMSEDEHRVARQDPGPLLHRTAELATEFLRGLPDRPVRVDHNAASLRATLCVPLPEEGEDPIRVIERLARDADPGIVSMPGHGTSAS